MGGARADDDGTRRVESVPAREVQDEAGKRWPAPARRRTGRVRAEGRLDRPRYDRGERGDLRVQVGRRALRTPVEDEVRCVPIELARKLGRGRGGDENGARAAPAG